MNRGKKLIRNIRNNVTANTRHTIIKIWKSIRIEAVAQNVDEHCGSDDKIAALHTRQAPKIWLRIQNCD